MCRRLGGHVLSRRRVVGWRACASLVLRQAKASLAEMLTAYALCFLTEGTRKHGCGTRSRSRLQLRLLAPWMRPKPVRFARIISLLPACTAAVHAQLQLITPSPSPPLPSPLPVFSALPLTLLCLLPTLVLPYHHTSP